MNDEFNGASTMTSKVDAYLEKQEAWIKAMIVNKTASIKWNQGMYFNIEREGPAYGVLDHEALYWKLVDCMWQ